MILDERQLPAKGVLVNHYNRRKFVDCLQSQKKSIATGLELNLPPLAVEDTVAARARGSEEVEIVGMDGLAVPKID